MNLGNITICHAIVHSTQRAVEPVGGVADEIEDTAPKKEKKEKKQRIASTYVRGKHYEKLNAEDCRQMLLYIADKILANEPYLTEVDSAIGDGDHGIGMATGMKNVKEVLLDMEGEKMYTVSLRKPVKQCFLAWAVLPVLSSEAFIWKVLLVRRAKTTLLLRT